MKVKLIAADLDGTLIPEGGKAPTEEDFRLIRQLADMGILFAVNSGRPYKTAHDMFRNVGTDIMFICDNGCNVVYRGRSLYCCKMDREICRRVMADVESFGRECELIMCTRDHFILIPKSPEIVDILRDKWQLPVKTEASFDDIDEDILKLSVFMHGGIIPDRIQWLRRKWSGRIKHLAISGTEWFDLQDGDKGTGMREGAEKLGIRMDETVAFGDNFNDLEMLDTAGLSYVMSTAPEAVKAHGQRVCPSVQGVLREVIRRGGEI